MGQQQQMSLQQNQPNSTNTNTTTPQANPPAVTVTNATNNITSATALDAQSRMANRVSNMQLAQGGPAGQAIATAINSMST